MLVRWFAVLCAAACSLFPGLVLAQDADADGLPDVYERLLGDFDGDGVPNELDADDDNDTRPTRDEQPGAYVDRDGDLRADEDSLLDTDGDQLPDYLDSDEDGDELIGLAEDIDGDGILTAADDTDGDGLIDSLDADDDGDDLPTRMEFGGGGVFSPRDTDGDLLPDYRDGDDDGDGVQTRVERRFAPEADRNGNGIVAYLDAAETGPEGFDTDNDGVLDDIDEDDDDDLVLDALENEGDSDGDGVVDRLDVDDDGDRVETRFELGNPSQPTDTDNDGQADYLDPDDDGDGLLTRDEEPDSNADGRPNDARETIRGTRDYLNGDDDGDGVPTREERPALENRDSDGDGIFDHYDLDDDGDGRETDYERGLDTDADGIGDWLDPDDDADTIPTLVECSEPLDRVDYDRDGLVNCLDLDSDADGLLDIVEGNADHDGNGRPDYLDNPALHAAPDAGPLTVVDAGGAQDAAIEVDAGRDAGAHFVPDAGGISLTARDSSSGCAVREAGTSPSAGASWILCLAALAYPSRRRLVRSVAWLLLVACEDADSRGTFTLPPRSLLDANLQEKKGEAGVVEAGSQDGGIGETSECHGDDLVFALPTSATRTFGATLAGDQVHLAYVAVGCDGVARFRDPRGLQYVRFSSTGRVDPLDVTGTRCAPVRRPNPLKSHMATDATVWLRSQGNSDYELQALDMSPRAQVVAQSELPELDGPLAVALLGGGTVQTALYTLALSQNGQPTSSPILSAQPGNSAEVLTGSAGHRPVRLALGMSGQGATERAWALWVSDRDGSRGIYARAVDPGGAGKGDVIPLAEDVGARSEVAIAARDEGGAIAYTEVRGDDSYGLTFREIASDGGLRGPRRLTPGEDVDYVAIAPYRNGYAVAYRRRGSELNRQAAIRLLLIDPEGNLGASRFVATTTISGTALSVLTPSDGRLVLIWDEEQPTVTDGAAVEARPQLHIARRLCH